MGDWGWLGDESVGKFFLVVFFQNKIRFGNRSWKPGYGYLGTGAWGIFSSCHCQQKIFVDQIGAIFFWLSVSKKYFFDQMI